MLRDRIIVGSLIGVLADVFKLLINYTAFLLGYTDVVFWQITATRFLEKGDLFNPAALIIGGAADLTVTAVLGVVFFLLIDYSGTDYLLLKGIGFGLAVWVGLFGFLLSQSVQGKIPQSPSGILVTLVAHFVFGLSLAFFTWLHYRQRMRHDDLSE